MSNNQTASDHNEFTEQQIVNAVEQSFPAEDFRQYQKKAIAETVKAFTSEDYDLVLLNAPTGSGKSLIIYTSLVSLQRLRGDSSFITTPLNSLVDQIDEDEFLSEVISLKGRNNYDCIHPDDSGTPVDEAICQRDGDFECEMKDRCEYYGRKKDAIASPQAVTNMSYIMAENMIPDEVADTFGVRDELAADECQRIEDFAMNFISFTVSYRTVPDQVWNNITIPPEEKDDDMEFLIKWLKEEVLRYVREELNRLDTVALKSKDQTKEEEKLEQFEMRVENFLDDVQDNDWVAQVSVQINKNRPNTKKITFKPIEIGRFLDNLLWNRAGKLILSSATIPGGGWLDEIGLGNLDRKVIPVPSTFPVENRPIVTNHAVGKMTKDEREDNFLPMMKKIKQISEHHEGEKGFIHCRSYNLAENLLMTARNNGMRSWVNENCQLQDQREREESLEAWFNNDKQIFFSVAMDEGIDLEGDKCRWQVLAKTLYKHMGDKRVRYRVMERGEWDWYNRHAVIQLQQAYGRGVRSPTDECVFYILDESAVGLIERNAGMFNKWFLEALHDLDVNASRGR
jgi:Rad3-related DNA helicase